MPQDSPKKEFSACTSILNLQEKRHACHTIHILTSTPLKVVVHKYVYIKTLGIMLTYHLQFQAKL